MNKDDIMKNTAMLTAKAVAHYWETRAAQRRRQEGLRRRRPGDRPRPQTAHRSERSSAA